MNSIQDTTRYLIDAIIEKQIEEHMITNTDAKYIREWVESELLDTVNCKPVDLEACTWL